MHPRDQNPAIIRGGDGALHFHLNGPDPANPILAMPEGTASDFSYECGIPYLLESSGDTDALLSRCELRSVDLLRIQGKGAKASWSRNWITTAGFGVGATTCAIYNRIRKLPGAPWLARLIGPSIYSVITVAVIFLGLGRAFRLRVRADEEDF